MTDLATSQRERDELRARAHIVASALAWLGKPYHHLGDRGARSENLTLGDDENW